MGAVVIFTKDVPRLASFYARVLAPTSTDSDAGDTRVFSPYDEVVVHSIPKAIADTIVLSTPPTPQEDVAIKPVFIVDDIDDALEAVVPGGGLVTTRSFVLDGIARHDIVDPDGNIVQLRARTST